MKEGTGPHFPKPLKDVADLAGLHADVDVDVALGYVFEAITLTRTLLDGKVPLIGFCGAPWTLMAYMIEGGGSKTFSKGTRRLRPRPALTLWTARTDLGRRPRPLTSLAPRGRRIQPKSGCTSTRPRATGCCKSSPPSRCGTWSARSALERSCCRCSTRGRASSRHTSFWSLLSRVSAPLHARSAVAWPTPGLPMSR